MFDDFFLVAATLMIETRIVYYNIVVHRRRVTPINYILMGLADCCYLQNAAGTETRGPA